MVGLGGVEISQGTLSKWENYKASPKLRESVVAARQYIALVAEELPDASGSFDEEASFVRAIGTLLGERPMTPRRAELHGALTSRLRHGPAFSDADVAMAQLLLRDLAAGDGD